MGLTLQPSKILGFNDPVEIQKRFWKPRINF